MTAYVVAGLAQAKAAGHAIPEERLQNGVAWLTANVKPDTAADLRAYVVYAISNKRAKQSPSSSRPRAQWPSRTFRCLQLTAPRCVAR